MLCLRFVFYRAEGLTFEVVQAGLEGKKNIFRRKAGEIMTRMRSRLGLKPNMTPALRRFKKAGEIITQNQDTKESFTDKFIDSHIKGSPHINRTVKPRDRFVKSITTGKAGAQITKYSYSSDDIHKGLKRAIVFLMYRKVNVIVGDCGFGKGIQEIVTEIIRKQRHVNKEGKKPPCLMSTLTLLPTMLSMIATNAVVFVLTSNGASFEKIFKRLTDNAPKDKVKVLGLEDVPFFGKPVSDGTSVIMADAWPGIKDAIENKKSLLKTEGKHLGAILCECSELPAFSSNIRKEFKVPVFDSMTCATTAAGSVLVENSALIQD